MREESGSPGREPGQKSSFNLPLGILPQSEDSEISVLGAIIREGDLIEKALLSPTDFYSTKNREVFSVMKDMERRCIPIDIDTLHREIKKAGKEDITGGFNYLGYLVESTPSIANFSHYVKQVREARIKRDIVEHIYLAWETATNGGSLETIQEGVIKLQSLLNTGIERPEIRKEAFYGLAGELINLISPHSEADPVALLASFLTAYGNIIGNNAYFRVEADKHPMRLFFVLVGDTSKGRKGTSWGHVKVLFEMLDPDWVKNIQTGLSSGEGVIWAVRDEIRKRQPVRKEGRIVDYEEAITDNGVKDKRLLVIESEFASPLKIMEREGNILSPQIRNAWDTGDLQILTKNSPAKATGAHISIIGHITRPELVRYLSTTEAGNGFGNRFLWFYVRRSKSLPYGGGFHQENLEPIIKKLKAVVEFGKDAGKMAWAEETRSLWEAVYPKLSEGKPGLVGALTARSEAYVTRLACIYALLDLSTEIRPEHLMAALAIWEYVEASVKYIFSNAPGGSRANKLRDALEQRPMTKTEIHNLYGRNSSSEQLEAQLNEVGAKKEIVTTGGRPKEIWKLK